MNLLTFMRIFNAAFGITRCINVYLMYAASDAKGAPPMQNVWLEQRML